MSKFSALIEKKSIFKFHTTKEDGIIQTVGSSLDDNTSKHWPIDKFTHRAKLTMRSVAMSTRL